MNTTRSTSPAAGALPSGIDAAKLADASVSNAEFQRLDGVTSAIQTQITNVKTTADAALPASSTKLPPTPSGAGKILVDNGSAYAALAPGSDGQVLTLASGTPAWASASSFAAAFAGGTLDTGTFGALSTSYLPTLNSAGITNTQRVLYIVTRAGTIKNLVASFKTAPGGSDTVIFTVQKSSDFGVTWTDTTLTCTVTGAAKTATDTTHAPAVALYDWLAIKMVSSANTAAGPITVGAEVS